MSGHRGARIRGGRVLLVSAALSVVVSATLLGVALAVERTPEQAHTPPAGMMTASGAAVEPMTDWVDVLGWLDAARSRAFSSGAVAGLRDVYTAGSAAMRGDSILMRRYAARGLRVEGLRMEVRDLRLLDYDSAEAVLRVRDRIGAGTVVGRRGLEFALPADGWTTQRITLRLTPGGWRITAIT